MLMTVSPFICAVVVSSHKHAYVLHAVVLGLDEWLKCNIRQGNAVPPLPIYGLKRSPPQIDTI